MTGGCHIHLTCTNKGRYTIKSGKWEIYFSCLRPISNSLADALVLSPTKIAVSHINGYLLKMQPTEHFSNVLPDRKTQFDLSTQGRIGT